jgi:hypothetical protein
VAQAQRSWKVTAASEVVHIGDELLVSLAALVVDQLF